MNKLPYLFIPLLLVLLLPGSRLFCQNGQNPFDLPNRQSQELILEPEPDSADTSNSNASSSENTNPEKQLDNPFDLPGSTTIKPIEVAPISSQGNPFEVKRIKTPLSNSNNAAPSPVLQPSKNIKPVNNRNFLFFTGMLLILFMTMLVILYRPIIGQIYRAFLNDNILKLKHREQGLIISLPLALLYLSFYLNAGFFIYLSGHYFGWFENQTSNYLLLGTAIAAVSGVFILKHIVLRILGSIFPIQKELRQYSFTIVVFNIILGILLLPFNLLIAFGPQNFTKPLIISFLTITFLSYVFRSFRSLLIASRHLSLHKFHFFMYLCTVEIAPTLLLVKLLLMIEG